MSDKRCSPGQDGIHISGRGWTSQRLQTYFSYLETTVCLTGWAVIDHHVTRAEQSITMDYGSPPPWGSVREADILIIHSQRKPYILGLAGCERYREAHMLDLQFQCPEKMSPTLSRVLFWSR